jgi:hypothetical protein
MEIVAMLGEFVMSEVVASVPVSTAITRRAMRTRRQPAILIRVKRDEGIPERSRRRSGSRGQRVLVGAATAAMCPDSP